MKIKTISFVAVAAVAALFVGCEWTSSDGDPSWSGSYDDALELDLAGFDFSGTYRNDTRGGCAIMTKDGSSEVATPSVSTGNSVSITKNVWDPVYSTTIELPSKPVVGSVAVKAVVGGKTLSWSNDGNGNLTGSSGIAGTGSVSGNTVILKGYQPGQGNKNDPVTVTYIPEGTSSTPVVSGSGAVLAITVSQLGANIKLTTSNGVTMSGNIVNVGWYTNGVTQSHLVQFNASSSGNSFVGTLDNRSGVDALNGTWTSGSTIYDVNGFKSNGN